ncbi:MAG TPA: VanZ family protein [Clostridia bacterium]|nr:VanZ family protein [Clostridia bacterium]
MFKYKNLIHVFSWIAVFFWMVLIFSFSSQTAEQSNALSSGITQAVIKTVEKIAPKTAAKMDMGKSNHIIRKNSHFFLYLILGALFINAIRQSKICGIRGVIITFLFCSLYAISDEVHQLFVPGRGAQVKDVFIDIAGAAVGIFLSLWRFIRMGG